MTIMHTLSFSRLHEKIGAFGFYDNIFMQRLETAVLLKDK